VRVKRNSLQSPQNLRSFRVPFFPCDLIKMNAREESGWKIYPDSVSFESPVLRVYTGPVVCGRSGRKKNFSRLDFPDRVNSIAITADKKMVLIRQFRYGSGEKELEIPGGLIEQGEEPVEAGMRELMEESGYSGETGKVIGKVNPNPALQRNCCYTVLIENAVRSGEQELDEMEDIKVELYEEEQVLRGIFNQTLEISHGLALNGLSFYLQYRLQGRIDSLLELSSTTR